MAQPKKASLYSDRTEEVPKAINIVALEIRSPLEVIT